MAWRKWLVRGLVVAVAAAAAAAAVLYQSWTNPAAVRRQVLDHVRACFVPDAVSVSLESAQLRLLGGIAVGELRLARSDGLDRRDFLYVPSAVVYHDKERLLDGSLAVRKVELNRPQLRLVRERDGRCNLSGLLAPGGGRGPAPTLVVRRGTVELEDRAAPGGPVLELTDVNLTAVDDPPGVYSIEGSGRTDVAGPVQVHARVVRATGEVTATVEASAVPVGPDLMQRLAAVLPDCAKHLGCLRGEAAVTAAVAYRPGGEPAWTYDMTCRLAGGALSHPALPLALDHIDAEVHCVDGRVPLAHVTARCGETRLELTLKDVTLPPTPPEAPCVYDLARELDLQVDHLNVTDDLFARLPDALCDIQKTYKPTGLVSVTHTFRREGPGGWRKRWVVRADGAAEAEYALFRYKMDHIKGTVECEATAAPSFTTAVDLTASAGGRPVTVKGTYRAEGGEPGAVDFDITGRDIPLDDRVYNALPEPTRKVAAQFLPERSRRAGLRAEPMGKADVTATVRRKAGKDEPCACRYVIDFKDASAKYDLFPYPVEQVCGRLDVRPDHWECIGFRCRHGDGVLHVDGRSFPPPAGAAQPSPVCMEIRGEDIRIDEEDFENALSPPDRPARAALRKTRETLALSGRMNFRAVVNDVPDREQDVDVEVNVSGCTARPRFFPYALEQVSGKVRYARGTVFLTDLKARHGQTVLRLPEGQVTLKPGGGFQARLPHLAADTLAPDADLLEALPEALRRGVKGLKLTRPVDAAAYLIIDAPPEPAGPVVLWWDGGAALHDATVQAGVELTGVDGEVSCCGLFDGRRLQSAVGNVLLDRAEILGQPLRNVHCRLEVQPDTPEVLRFRDLKADLFGGAVGGEARVEFGPALKYDVVLKALRLDLAEFGRHNRFGADAQMEGPAMAQLHLSGEGADVGGLKGNGRIDVPAGKLYRLPLLLDLLKATGLHAPDRTAFEEGHAVFAIDGPQVRVQRLDLYGAAVSLRGQGTVGLFGDNINLDFSADWGRLGQVLPPAVGDVPRAVSDQLLKIKVRGRAGDVRFEKDPLPGVLDPLLHAWGQEPGVKGP
jgi:hypothetical protein